jgi:hypothetical protein
MHGLYIYSYSMRVLMLFICCSIILNTNSEILTIDNTQYPFINVMKHNSPVIWHEKAIAFKMSMSHAVRINSRGIQFLPIGMTSLSFYDKNKDVGMWSYFRENEQSQKWNSFTCTPARDSLCHIQLNGLFHVRVFPNTGETVYIAHGNEVSEKISLIANTCSETDSHRTSSHSYHGSFKSDISLCNVVGGGMDYVFIPSENRIYILRTSINFQIFLMIAVLTIHISIVMAHNMEILMGMHPI